MNLDAPITAISAVIDSLGLVIARLLVVTLVCLFGSIPAFLIAFLISTYAPNVAGFFSVYYFVSFYLLLFVACDRRMKGPLTKFAKTHKKDVPIRPVEAVVALPILPFILLLVFLIKGQTRSMFTERHYLNEENIKSLVMFIDAVFAFALGVYLLAKDPQIGVKFFDSGYYPNQFIDALSYTIDVAIRGFFFDFFEHFNLHVSNVHQSSNLIGKIVSYTLRLASSVLAISLFLEMVSVTREKLRRLDQSESHDPETSTQSQEPHS